MPPGGQEHDAGPTPEVTGSTDRLERRWPAPPACAFLLISASGRCSCFLGRPTWACLLASPLPGPAMASHRPLRDLYLAFTLVRRRVPLGVPGVGLLLLDLGGDRPAPGPTCSASSTTRFRWVSLVRLLLSVTPLLDAAMIYRIAGSGVRAVSVSRDGRRAKTHDGVRGIAGHFSEQTVAAIAQLVAAGITVQVNTTVMDGVDDLPGIAALVAQAVDIWEVSSSSRSAAGRRPGRSACRNTRTCATPCTTRRPTASSSGPSKRRSSAASSGRAAPAARRPAARCTRACQLVWSACSAPEPGAPVPHTAPTRDGKGIVFVSHDGQGSPGWLPASRPGQHPDPAVARDLPGRPAAEVDPRGEVHRALRKLRVRRPVRRITGPRLRRRRW